MATPTNCPSWSGPAHSGSDPWSRPKKLSKLKRHKHQVSQVQPTSRSKTRQSMAENTRPKRDKFLLAYRDLFLPLLPKNNNCIAKLQISRGTTTTADDTMDRYGNKSSKGAKSSPAFDMLVTSYEVFVAEQNWFKVAFAWRYMVLDEGHKIKNAASDVATALQSIQAENRLLLTGTPLQNNLHEMCALLHWLYPDVFAAITAERFQSAFDLSAGKVSTRFMNDARRLLELIMFRRMKSSPGVDLDLPPKEEVHLYVPLTPMQRFWYLRMLTKAGNTLLDHPCLKGGEGHEAAGT